MSARTRRSTEGTVWRDDMAESWIDTRPGVSRQEYGREELGRQEFGRDEFGRPGLTRTEWRGRQQDHATGLANALGWFSLGLGVAQVVAPDSVARLIGVESDDRTRNIMRGIGAREIASGVGILTNTRPTNWVRARVAGDAMDLALLTRALRTSSTDRQRTSASLAAVLAIGVLDAYCAQRLMPEGRAGMVQRGEIRERGAREREGVSGIEVRESITVAREPSEVYEFWHNFENLPRFMRHLENVERTGPGRSHWTAKGPAGVRAEWDAELTEDRPNECIAWRSIDGSMVENEGVVEFRRAPGNRGTEVHVRMRYAPPGGRISAAVAKLLHREPGQQIEQDLRAFKQVMETGEVSVSDATVTPGPHPAQPPSRDELRERAR